ncbi:MAG TPA: 23S rRNA (uridine(2552)-2'-O)-methyltransferase RlmE [Burkholderiales bacterium]|nr:23S rRNA (uridine(2552)-2'-O)-methyltransferase RlmE [Burkholderiales bacterium]
MKRTKSSSNWMREHVNDFYVESAKRQGFRSRAAFKLLEIDERDRLLSPGMTVVDLGAAPGSWSQVAAEKVGARGKVIALDILQMQPIAGVDFICGDLRQSAVLKELRTKIHGKAADLVICDISPNISGVSSHDQARTMELAQLALEFSAQVLKPEGGFLVKVFHGEGFEDFLKAMRSRFKQVNSRKPKASRARSSEIYLLGRNLKLLREG